jgi:hypothetical protein
MQHARRLGDVVDVERGAGNVLAGAVVRLRSVHARSE